jgi:hypothetical protein
MKRAATLYVFLTLLVRGSPGLSRFRTAYFALR